MQNIEITKFKVKGDWDELHISYEIPPEDTEKRTVNYICKERPRNELILAFDKLMNHVRAIAGLNWETGMIRLISFKEGEEGLLVNVTAQDEGDYKIKAVIDPFYPTGDLLEAIAEAVDYLKGYVNGDRAQATLFEFPIKSAAPPEEVVSALGF